MTTQATRTISRPREEREEQILNAAMFIATEKGYRSLTRDGVAERAEVSAGLVNYMFGNMDNLRAKVIEQTIHVLEVDLAQGSCSDPNLLKILAQGLATGISEAKQAPEGIKAEALRMLC